MPVRLGPKLRDAQFRDNRGKTQHAYLMAFLVLAKHSTGKQINFNILHLSHYDFEGKASWLQRIDIIL